MGKMKEINVSLSKFLLVRFLTTMQEYNLRWEQNRFRWIVIVLVIILLFFLNLSIGIIAFSLLLFSVIFDFFNDLLITLKLSKAAKKHSSEVTYLDFDIKGFQRYTPDHFFWGKVLWKNVSFGIYFEKQNAIVLYDKLNKEYHFFFKKAENESDFENLRKVIFSCVRIMY